MNFSLNRVHITGLCFDVVLGLYPWCAFLHLTFSAVCLVYPVLDLITPTILSVEVQSAKKFRQFS
jgi:hypothetical protein